MPVRRTVLLVDDDALVRLALAEALGDLGFEVIEAQSAADALDYLPGLHDLDVLITDILMPGLDGWTLSEKVRESRPDLPVVYITGFFGDNARPVPGAQLIHKPFTVRAIARVLGGLLC